MDAQGATVAGIWLFALAIGLIAPASGQPAGGAIRMEVRGPEERLRLSEARGTLDAISPREVY
jgi:hypothetical protein